ncbi:MAG: ABC transporter substrate-binding protein [Chloroflexota bacterium]
MSRRRFLALGGPAVAMTLLAACSAAPAAAPAPTTAPPVAASSQPTVAAAAPAAAPTAAIASTPAQTRTLTIAVEQDASSLKPDTWGPSLNWYAARTMYDTLLHYKTAPGPDGLKYYVDGDWEMRLASKVEVSQDRQTVTWTMRDNATFESGKKIDAAAIVKSFQWYLDRAEVGGSQAKADGLVSRDDISVNGNQVIMKLKFPAPWGASANYISLLAVVDADEVMSHATADDKFGAKWMERNTTASGPYKLEKWVPSEQMVVTARPDWYGGQPNIQRIVFRVIPDPSVRFSLLKKGDVDMASNLDYKDLDALKADPNITIDSWIGNDWQYVGMNFSVKELQDRNVRKAIASAIPTDEIISSVYYGMAVPAKTPFGQRVVGADPSTWPYTFNLDQAKTYLSQSAFPGGFTTTFSIPNNDINVEKSAQLIAESLSKLGIKLTIEKQTASQASDALVAKKVSMAITGFTSFVPDPGYHALWNHLPDSFANYWNYKNPDQEQIGRQMLYMDPKDPQRTELLKQYQVIMADDVFGVYFASVKPVVAHKKSLTGFAYYPDYPIGMRFDNLTMA